MRAGLFAIAELNVLYVMEQNVTVCSCKFCLCSEMQSMPTVEQNHKEVKGI